jgi:anti-anti-sigma factor
MLSTTADLRDGPLVLSITTFGATRSVAVTGELDLSNARTLQSLLDEFDRDGAEVVVLDLEALEFIDSTGLALLVNSHRRLNGEGECCLRLIPARAEGVRRVLAATELDRTLPFVEQTALSG